MSDKKMLMEKAVAAFKKHFGRNPEIAVAAPGRSNVIGEHTDYNDGHVLPIAIDRYTIAVAANREDRKFGLYTENLKKDFIFDADNITANRPRWVSYILGVVAELEKDGFKLRGKDIAVYTNVPIGSGLSSSAALEISVATAIERLEELDASNAQVVNACRRADHNYVGVNSGPMDQFASRACKAGHVSLLDCRSLEMTHHPLPDGIEFLSIYSGIPRSLATSEYNERQASCTKAVEILSKADPAVKALRDATPELVEQCKEEMGDMVYRRAKHVVTEQKRVFDIIKAFAENDHKAIGTTLLAGHKSLADDYEVSLPVMDEMVDWLMSNEGVIGARITGAGFGGSMICLVDATKVDVDSLSKRFVEEFQPKTPEAPELWKLTSVDGARYQPTLEI